MMESFQATSDIEIQNSVDLRNTPLHRKSGSTSSSWMMRMPAALLLIGVIGSFPVVNALAATSTKTHTASRVASVTESITNQRNKEVAYSWTDEILGPDTFEDELEDFHRLDKAVGSEILDSSLQKQIDGSLSSPNSFLDKYLEDASNIEKVAMASVTQQLPKRAVIALRESSRRKKKNSKLVTKKERISHEEELDLAQKIQRGVVLHNVKTTFEEQHGRVITKNEWAKEAGLKSSRELRKQVSQYRVSKQKLVESNMGLVHAVVKQQPNRRELSFEELVQEGSLGLMRAAELFDPNKGIRFSTYATIWIKGVLNNSHLGEAIVLPQREKTKWNHIEKARRDLSAELQRQPTHDEIAALLRISPEEVLKTSRRMQTARNVLSLDYQYTSLSRSGAASSQVALLEQDKAMMCDVNLVEQTQLKADVVAALANSLDAREARIIRLRYGLSDGVTRTIQECADEMGISKAYVQRLAKNSLVKLREAADAESLEEYLLTIV